MLAQNRYITCERKIFLHVHIIYYSKFGKCHSKQISITKHSIHLKNLNQSANLESVFSYTLPVQRRTFLPENNGEKIMLLNQSHKFLEFLKSQSKTSKIQQYAREYISAVRCTSERGQMTKLEKVATSHNCNFMGGWCFLYLCKNNLQKKLTKVIMFVK